MHYKPRGAECPEGEGCFWENTNQNPGLVSESGVRKDIGAGPVIGDPVGRGGGNQGTTCYAAGTARAKVQWWGECAFRAERCSRECVAQRDVLRDVTAVSRARPHRALGCFILRAMRSVAEKCGSSVPEGITVSTWPTAQPETKLSTVLLLGCALGQTMTEVPGSPCCGEFLGQ